MKKFLLIVSILLILLGVCSLLLAGLFWYASTHTLDGSAGLYHRQRLMALAALLIGILLLAGGIACLVLRGKLNR